MKTEEDEAFDDIARRQGGGFQAKRKMAADKLQEPPSEWAGIKAILDEYGLQAIDFVADFKEALAQPAQEPDMLTIAYQSGYYDGKKATQRPWVGLTEKDIERIKLMTYEKETNADGEEQEAVNIDWLIKTTEHFCKEKNS
jgi:hypothetical protein